MQISSLNYKPTQYKTKTYNSKPVAFNGLFGKWKFNVIKDVFVRGVDTPDKAEKLFIKMEQKCRSLDDDVFVPEKS